MKNLMKIISVALVMLFMTAFISVNASVINKSAVVYGDDYVSKYFNIDKIINVNIKISEENWKYMLENGLKEEFQVVDVTINNDNYKYVNFRTKGNSSLSTIAKGDSNTNQDDKRYSFKINFNDIIKTQTMAGLTQLNLNNCFSDPSYMREYLSYQIFKAMGLPVPAFSYAAVYINGDYYGLYLAVESILEPYLERNFGNITGDLYKSTGNTLKYTGIEKNDTNGLEVKSTRRNADLSELSNMLKVLNTGGDIEKYLNVDEALRYIAVSTALLNFDSYQGNFGHNYYLYEDNGVFNILPWDLNMSFGGFSFGGDVTKLYIDEPTQGSLADRPLIAKLFENKSYLETYHKYIKEVALDYLNPEYLKKEITKISNLIDEYVKTDPTAFYTFEEYKKNITLNENESIKSSEIAKIANPESLNANKAELDDQANIQENRKPNFMQNTLPLIPLAAATKDTILKQISGEAPSTNSGNGMSSDKNMQGNMGQMPPMDGEFQGQPMQGIPPMMEGGQMPRDGNPPPGMEGRQRPNNGNMPPIMEGGQRPMDGAPPMFGLNSRTVKTTIPIQLIIFEIIAGLILLISILGLFFIKRRRWISA
jgi:spore coat protein H